MEPLALTQPALTSRPPGKGCFGTDPELPLGKQLQVKLERISDSNRQLLLQSSKFQTQFYRVRAGPSVGPESRTAQLRMPRAGFLLGHSRWQAIKQPTLRVSQGPPRKSSARPCSEQAMGNQGFSWKDSGQ